MDGFRIYGLLGYFNWDLDSDSESIPGGSVAVDGDADVTAVGAGVDYLLAISEKASLSLGANIQYQFLSSDIDFTFVDVFGVQRGSVYLDDAASVFVGADFLYALSDQVALLFGAGYLFNISKSDFTLDNFEIADTKFDGVTLRAGIHF